MSSNIEAAIAIHRQGNLDEASEAYRAILQSEPNNANAYNFLGMLEFQRGNSDLGIELTERCLGIHPEHAGACNNIANMYLSTYQVDRAEQYYKKSIEQNNQTAEPFYNLAIIHKSRKNFAEAENFFKQALTLAPHHTVAMSGLATMYTSQGLLKPALELLQRVLQHDINQNDQKSTLQAIAKLCRLLGDTEGAIATYNKWLDVYPDDPTAKHMLAATSGEEVPVKPDELYIKDLFDRFSSSFDNVLANLDYKAPQLIEDIVNKLYPISETPPLEVLDAGCGTGLCGNYLKPIASQLTGVDLSSGMLSKARFRNVYDNLQEVDLNTFLAKTNKPIDLIVSADTLCYFGDLSEFLRLSNKALRQGGRLIFTVEKFDGESETGYHLAAHGRYGHTRDYVQKSIQASGLMLESINEEDLRQERGEAVRGFVLVLVKH